MSKKLLSREEWLKAIIDGAIGELQRDFQRLTQVKYHKNQGEFFGKFKYESNLAWRNMRMDGGSITTKYWLVEEEVEMSIKDIEKALGISNLKIIKEA